MLAVESMTMICARSERPRQDERAREGEDQRGERRQLQQQQQAAPQFLEWHVGFYFFERTLP